LGKREGSRKESFWKPGDAPDGAPTAPHQFMQKVLTRKNKQKNGHARMGSSKYERKKKKKGRPAKIT